MMLFAVLFLLMMSARDVLVAQQISSQTACGNAEVLGIVRPNTFSQVEIEKTSKQLIQSHSGSRLFYAVIGATEASVLQSVRQSEVKIIEPALGTVSDEPERAIQRSAQAFKRGARVAAVLRLENDAIVARWEHGTSLGHLRLTGSRDPTALRPGYSLLHIRLFQAKPGKLGAALNPCQMSLYIKSDRDLSTSGGADLHRYFEQLFPAINVTVKIRNDDWFVDDDGYADLPILPEHLALPSARTWLETPQVICTPNGWPRDTTPRCGLVKWH